MQHKYIKQWVSPLQPQKDELLSSWISRVALSYYINSAELFSKHLIKYNAYKRDLDIAIFDDDFWSTLSYLSQLSVFKLKSMQILDLEGKLQKKIYINHRNRWIVASSGNIYPNKRKSKSLRFCPLCLKEKGYYSKDSKLIFINVCTKHQVYMQDTCPKCNSIVLPIRLSPPKKIHECFCCGYDLSSINPQKASTGEVEAVEFSKGVLSSNIFLHQNHIRTALDYFTVLFLITKNLHRFSKKDRLLMEHRINKTNLPSSSPYLFLQPPSYLAYITAISYTLLTKEWNRELLGFIKRNKLMYASRLLNKRENVYYMIPLWFLRHLKQLWTPKLTCTI